MKILLIDGNSIINRAFYGIRMLNAPDGTPTNGVYGFLNILQKLLDEEQPEGLCVAFDMKAPTFRHVQYTEYKAQRKGMPEELAVQMPILKEVLDAMGIRRCELEGWEADDLLGTLSRRCEAADWDCRIVTGDKDSFQLITDRVWVKHVKTRMGQTETIDYSPERFREEYGFAPAQMVDLKALMGDASDNIPGVPGVGEKTAMDLIRRYGTVEAIYRDLDALDVKPAVRKKLEQGEESARMSRDLATIRCDAPLELPLEETRWSGGFRPELYDVFLRLGFSRLIQRYGLQPGAAAEEEPAFSGACTLEPVTDAAAAARAAAALAGGAVYVCWEDGGEHVVFHDGGGRDGAAYSLDRENFSGDYDAALGALFAASDQKVGHGIKDIQRNLLERGLPAGGWRFDTALAAYLLDATAGSYDLARLTQKYCGFTPWTGEAEKNGQLSLLDGEGDAHRERARRAALAAALACLEEPLSQKLRELDMETLYYEIELPLCPVLAEMERAGFLVDRAALAAFGEGLTAGIDALQGRIWAQAGEEFNILSPKQLGHILFDKLQLPAGKKTKTGWSTNADVLEKLRDKDPIVQDVLDYRMLTKLKSTYADGLLKEIGPDGRIHTNFQMTVTATGRLSSTEPNLQNIPVRRELGGEIRKMFVAGPGQVLVDADYSQIELRLLAHISGDETMLEAFRRGEDIHTVTASQVFGVAPEDVTPVMRSRAKAVNFGIVYGISAFSLAQDIGVYQNEAKAYMDAYLEKYHGVRQYMHDIVEQAKAQGYVETLWHRRRALPELKAGNYSVRSFGERVALNMPIQGTAADIIKLAMVRVHRRLREEGLQSRLLLQVHDELIVECPEPEAERVRALVAQEMEQVASLSVPLVAEAHIGRTWAEAKG